MLTITSIKNGIVIDHIKSGYGIKIFNYLNLKNVEYSVALIMNVFSNKLGKKDIIKIANKEIDIDFTVLGLIDPTITINIIEDERIKEKLNLELPKKVEDVIRCKNPRCITSIEEYIPHVFYLIDKEKVEYKCKYCDEICKVVEE
ncbi:aspartate carbamoyltransferase regulatory subunit [Clostridium tetani]|uniref:Aspartate carbamoyltransferase regulatory chain n=1 Tax=Clostridium tetani TaxID=1513 RepID=A0A4Q0VDS9_CLOTA|nr:aspartate carbamoyltransferase regulatory subunit [Clostridium tetani]KGI45071.1 aspartate carbamoyltransferase [Clostridium tetani]RXI48898.1 aspartate carbamoyltransferase regulatory subunit [Clostridium tetani]RXI73530.1 aspartate carbamoyltransferase regulatory subunit [Clostridium tetani]BDR73604.1 aspartate carbamoyltransferase regulatory chain [Clostridium tetani]BDR76546.1 aspartate carbamoyltransferase regulatory chain [Clostridium tetani]